MYANHAINFEFPAHVRHIEIGRVVVGEGSHDNGKNAVVAASIVRENGDRKYVSSQHPIYHRQYYFPRLK